MGAERQLVVRALRGFSDLRRELKQGGPLHDGSLIGVQLLPPTMVAMQSLWRIINRRLRLEGLPPYQSASMIVDILTGGQIEMISPWLNGEVSYLSGVGFVSNEVYNNFMNEEQRQRERALGLYTTSFDDEALDSVAWISKRRAAAFAAKVRMRRKNALSAGLGRAASTQKRRVHFSQRSAFLRRHDLHGHDEYLHHVASHTWIHKAASANATTFEQRVHYSIQASAAAGDYIGALDQLLELLGAQPGTLANIEDTLVDFFSGIWDSVTDDGAVFDQIEDAFLQFINNVACDVAQDVKAGGTGKYKLGCIPFLPERAFDWYEAFPQDPSGKGVLGWLEGPGYIEWPAEMIDVDCPVPRVPSQQDPTPEEPFWRRVTTTVPVEGDPGINDSAPKVDIDLDDVGDTFVTILTGGIFNLSSFNFGNLLFFTNW